MKAFCLLSVVLLMFVLVGCKGEKTPPAGEPTPPLETTEATPGTEPEEEPAAEEKKPPEVKLDRIKVDVKAKRITIEGRFCLREGILDYLAVTSGGQEYESVVALNCKGSLLHAGLLALGAHPGPTQQVIDELKKNPPEGVKIPERPGTTLRITAEWEKDGKTVSVPASRLLFNRKAKKAQATGEWVFTGSYFAKDLDGKTEFYMADIDKAIIGVFYTASAVINFSEDAGNPYAGDDEGYEVNAELVEPLDTPIKLVITLAEKAAD